MANVPVGYSTNPYGPAALNSPVPPPFGRGSGSAATGRGVSTGPRPGPSAASQLPGAVKNQPLPANLSKYYEQMAALYQQQLSGMQSLYNQQLAAQNRMMDYYGGPDPVLEATLALERQLRGMYDPNFGAQYHQQMMGLYGDTPPRASNTIWQIGYS